MKEDFIRGYKTGKLEEQERVRKIILKLRVDTTKDRIDACDELLAEINSPQTKPSNNITSMTAKVGEKLDKTEDNIPKGCGKKMDAIGYIICGKFDDLKHGGKQWLCEDCEFEEHKKHCGCCDDRKQEERVK